MVGIIVYSQTGNTYTAAERIKEDLLHSGYSAEIKQIMIEGDEQAWKRDKRFKNIPEVENYEAVIFGSPVQAFSLNPVMKHYLKQLPSLEKKKIFCFVTKALPFNWTGGNHSVSTMAKICRTKGGELSGTGIIKWRDRVRDTNIDETILKISSILN